MAFGIPYSCGNVYWAVEYDDVTILDLSVAA